MSRASRSPALASRAGAATLATAALLGSLVVGVPSAAAATGSTALADFDGDGASDLGVFRPAAGQFLIEGQDTTWWGGDGDVDVSADYDGDGSADIAVFRPSTGQWFVEGGASTYWGSQGDVAVPADYDGDGSADIAVFRPSTGQWFVDGGASTYWGEAGDVAVPADYDGNGTADIAVFRPSTGQWFVEGGASTYWGGEGDVAVPADYDGNGSADIAVFRPSTGQWFIEGGASTYWGSQGDVAVPADYDGDGATDIAVFRPSTGQWFVEGGASTWWGGAGDLALTRSLGERQAADAAPVDPTPVDTTAPAAPADVTTVLGDSSVTVTWAPAAEDDLAGYDVQRTEAGGEPVELTDATLTGTSFTDETATVGTRYSYTVTATDTAANTSAPSTAAVATPVDADVVVAADGSADATTVQAGVDLVPNNADHRADPQLVLVQPGTYEGLVTSGNRYGVTMMGATTDPADTVLTAADAANPTVSLSGAEWSLLNLTVANTNGTGVAGAQATALKVNSGDRDVFDNVAFLGNKQTLQLQTSNTTTYSRLFFSNAYVEGGQDIVLGRAVAVFESSTIHVLDQPNAAITDSSISSEHPYGFLITDSEIVTDGAAESIYLGRPYPASTTSQAQVTIRDTELGAAINTAQPWKDWNATTPWTSGRFSEYQNTGPGATVNANRPQLTDEQAAQHTKAAYLAGTDGWAPVGQQLPTEPADTTAPAAPAGLTATAGDGQVELTWTANADSDLAGYDLYRAAGTTVEVTAANKVNTELLTGSSYTDRAVVSGTGYAYVLTAVDGAGNASAASATVSATPTGEVLPAHDLLVAQDGSGDFTTVQAAVDAAGAGTTGDPVVIAIKPGTYRELVSIPKNDVSLLGTTGTATDVVLSYDNAAGTINPATGSAYGTGNSQSVLVKGNDVTVSDLTIENAFDEAAATFNDKQAVALNTTGDRLVFDNVRLLGNQDTLLVNSGDANRVARSYFVDSYVEGDVDFVFGRGTAVFDRSTIHALSRGSSSNNGYLTAASTADDNRYGILITDSTVTSDAPAETFSLGRPWRGWSDDYTKNGVEMPNSRGQVTIRETELPAAIRTSQPWADMSPNLWTDGRFAEYANTGAGATVNANRPQLTAAEATEYTKWDYLAGSDSWNPIGSEEPAAGDITAPAAPAGLTAATDGAGVAVTWTANGEADLAGYHVYRATGSTVEATAANQLTTELLTEAGYRDTAVSPGVEYSYLVTAVDTTGNVSAASAPATLTTGGTPLPDHDLLVAQDGSGDFTTVQAAVDAAGAGTAADPVVIAVTPGEYRGVVAMPRDHVTLIGTTGNAADVVIVEDNAAGTTKPDGSGTYGSSGSATVLIKGSDITVRDLTFANDFDEATSTLSAQQALALKTQGDRLVFDNVRFLGDQDTLMVDSPGTGVQARSYFVDSYVEGDVDFIFGRGTAVFDRSTIFASTRGSSSNNGYITAGSIDISLPYGILITDSTVESDAPAGTFHLGRPWHPSGDVNAIAQVVIRDTELPAAIKSAPWTDMSGFSWTEARFSEFQNTGPGAGVNENRPQLSAAEAEQYTKWDYLAGKDGWNPTGEVEPPPSDTTAPAAPAGLAATVAPGAVTLDWADNAESDAAGYVVYRALTEAGSYARLTSSPITASTYLDNTVPVGSTGWYRVTAVDVTGNESAAATASATVTEGSGETRPLSVFVIGDSTASVYQANEGPRTGWGQALGLFTTENATVVDYAKSGASSKDYYDSGLFDRTLAEIQPGDFLLISFGHNDQKDDDPSRYTDPYGTYQEYLQRYIDGARAAGATPVLVTSVERRRFDEAGVAKTTHGEYPAAMRALAAEQGVAVVDLTAMSTDLWNELGPEGTKDYFLHVEPGEYPNYPDGRADDTHFQARGAIELARIVATSLAEQGVLPAGGDYFQRLDGAVADDEVVWPAKRPI
ncbi:pectinesterase family protein [Modestobacter sp. VKM Ac-2985]|uniref:pectinesterase family protein n=1 Tax=Modestobacter sp. VKM Ac-2985 TaxID=3004139 RepID=UPI0022AB7E60|nr:pectinesterase family protein [Modestobacter sp. VKM Ac-2985]MCZ2835966.1 pectinesterase family protein [Modestobacter sp. VKM Ac-2985]